MSAHMRRLIPVCCSALNTSLGQFYAGIGCAKICASRFTPAAQDHTVFGQCIQAGPATLTADERLTRNATRLPTMVSAASEYSARVVEPV